MSRSPATGYTIIVLAILLWSGNTIVGRAAMIGDVPPIALNLFRWTGAFLILLPFTAGTIWRQRAAFLSRWWYYLAFGFVSVTCFNTFFYLGLSSTTAVQGSLIMSILPILVLLWAAIFMGMPITARHVGGLVLTIGGAATVIVRGDLSVLATLGLNVGDLWCLGSVLMWSIQISMLRFKAPEVDTMAFMTVAMALGIIVLLPLYGLEAASGRSFPWSTETALMLAYLVVFASATAFSLYNAGVVLVGPANAGYFGNLFPVFSALLAVALLGETFAWYHALGAALVVAGIYLATAPPALLPLRRSA